MTPSVRKRYNLRPWIDPGGVLGAARPRSGGRNVLRDRHLPSMSSGLFIRNRVFSLTAGTGEVTVRVLCSIMFQQTTFGKPASVRRPSVYGWTQQPSRCGLTPMI